MSSGGSGVADSGGTGGNGAGTLEPSSSGGATEGTSAGTGATDGVTGGAGGDGSGAPAAEASVVINELMPSNATVIVDEAGGAGDWIELYNRSSSAVDLTGYFISDDDAEPSKAVLQGVSIPAGGTLLLWADRDIDQGPLHLPFALDRDGEVVLLSTPAGELLDRIEYVAASTDASFARYPDGAGGFAYCAVPTPNAPNDPSCAGG